jgi:FHS family L-fucose permease-like MFS transporter
VVPLCFFVGAWSYALAVNFWPWYKNTIDSYTDEKVDNGSAADLHEDVENQKDGNEIMVSVAAHGGRDGQ